MNDSILFNITMIIVLIGFATLIILVVCDYNKAKETCLELKSEEDCSYEMCMAEEYKSDKQRYKADSCMLKIIYKQDALGEDSE